MKLQQMRWWALGLAGWTLGGGCTPPSPEKMSPGEEIVAVYKDGEITRDEYQTWLEMTKREGDAGQRIQILETLAAQETLAAAARQREVEKTLPVRLALLHLEEGLLEGALFRELGQSIEATEEEIESWLAENGDRLNRPRRVRLSNIFKRLDGANKDSLLREMSSIREQLVAGADWAEMAMRESDSQTRFRHGRIGLVKPGSLEPAVEEVAFAMEPGDISEVIETQSGLTLLRCDEVKEETRPTDEQRRQQASRVVRQRKTRVSKSELEAELLEGVRLDVQAAQLVSTVDDAVIAQADGWSLSLAETRQLLRLGGVGRPLPDLPEARADKLLRAVAVKRQAAARARAQGLDQEPLLRAQLHWRAVLILATKELEHRVEQRFEPLKPVEIRAFYDADTERFRAPETFRLAAISIRAEAGQLPEKMALGQRLEADLRAGRLSFEEAAQRHSELPSAGRGGLLGWLEKQQVAGLGPHVLRAVDTLEAGDIGPLVQQPDALPSRASTLWLMHLLDRRPERPLTFEEARKQAENLLGNERTRALQKELEKELSTQLELREVDHGAL